MNFVTYSVWKTSHTHTHTNLWLVGQSWPGTRLGQRVLSKTWDIGTIGTGGTSGKAGRVGVLGAIARVPEFVGDCELESNWSLWLKPICGWAGLNIWFPWGMVSWDMDWFPLVSSGQPKFLFLLQSCFWASKCNRNDKIYFFQTCSLEKSILPLAMKCLNMIC